LFVYNRPSHTQRTVELLRKNSLAQESDLIVFSDAPNTPGMRAPVQVVRDYVRTITGFKSVTIIEREENLGLAASIVDGVTKVCGDYGRIVVLEDGCSEKFSIQCDGTTRFSSLRRDDCLFVLLGEVVHALITDLNSGVALHSGSQSALARVHPDKHLHLVRADELPINVVLALDLSGSVAGESLGHLRRAGNAVIDALGPLEQAALITFSQSISLGVGLTKDRQRVREALDAARGSGDTSLIDASYAALVLGEADTGRALVIVFSDGLDTSSWLSAASVLAALRMNRPGRPRADRTILVLADPVLQSTDPRVAVAIGQETGAAPRAIASGSGGSRALPRPVEQTGVASLERLRFSRDEA
jgi:hypothetical protein